jgi:hypothetical protein
VQAARSLDTQTVFVLLAATVLLIVQFTFGSRQLFREEFASFFPAQWQGLLAWGWWFGMQGVTGFVLPVLALLLFFGRRPGEIGLGLGDWRLATTLAALYIPIVAIGTWVLSDGAEFQAQYPHYQPATRDWTFFIIYELLFLFYWIGWEYLWRGFVLFGTAHTFGLYAIFVQTVPFAGRALHCRRCGARGARLALPLVLDRRAHPRRADAAARSVVHAPHPHRRVRRRP